MGLGRGMRTVALAHCWVVLCLRLRENKAARRKRYHLLRCEWPQIKKRDDESGTGMEGGGAYSRAVLAIRPARL